MNLNNIKSLTDQKKQFITQFVQDLNKIENLTAIALGGSHATGRANENSDIDMGLYYEEESPFDIQEIERIAKKYSTDESPVVVGFYEWGPWVNGGAWLHTAVGKVDLLYRNINQIKRTIADAQLGKWENHFEQQPPYGFTSMIYQAECLACIALSDANHILQELKNSAANYPLALKVNVINTALWSAEFTLAHADGFAKQNDSYNTFGCFTRALKSITEALFAINEIYPISDKLAIELLSKFQIIPNNFKEKVDAILHSDTQNLDKNVDFIKKMFTEVVSLTNGLYRPKFDFKK
ncbi:nucleotidyltransferase domain-containing protein [Sphingobacterium sp. UT-1RO-CII-1]|uniref:nucleotidyltransferase domain-containing protein n=1 Tax=Sphingobacterium sp. UT-1RO-CII-1 TaxID=2995225 RepID=UPI00227C3D9D|nr:nucleotidyltransferase domain-containing protein [Sphingobacterium sp. UT-1RO-CII-1]MCY4780582.1 nucleotidyltransferase domain-containing protein [Sphingobacterium sp. UT-1RO-CII-1]